MIPEFNGKSFVDSAGNQIEMADTFQLKRLKLNDADMRPVVACSLGVHVPNAILPHVDPNDTRTALTGAIVFVEKYQKQQSVNLTLESLWITG